MKKEVHYFLQLGRSVSLRQHLSNVTSPLGLVSEETPIYCLPKKNTVSLHFVKVTDNVADNRQSKRLGVKALTLI